MQSRVNVASITLLSFPASAPRKELNISDGKTSARAPKLREIWRLKSGVKSAEKPFFFEKTKSRETEIS